MNAGRLVLPVVALLAGLIIGAIDLWASEVIVPIGLLLVASFVLSAAGPPQAWLSAMVIGLGLPLFHVITALLGFRPADTPQHYLLMAIVAVIPASLGAAAGAGVQWLLRAA